MAGLKISELLKWKTNLILLNPEGNPILDDKKKPVEVWLRVIGDDDLDKAHTAARIASAEKRKLLKDKDSQEYKDRVEPIIDAPREDCIDVLRTYRTSNLYAEARVKTVRPELPTMVEVAVEPDAPTLEETEKLDALVNEQEAEYQKQIETYVEDRTAVILAELEAMETDELRQLTMDEISGVIALAEFYTVLLNEKVFRGAFTDKPCTVKAFDTMEELIITDAGIKQQLFDTYSQLEFDPDSIKK